MPAGRRTATAAPLSRLLTLALSEAASVKLRHFVDSTHKLATLRSVEDRDLHKRNDAGDCPAAQSRGNAQQRSPCPRPKCRPAESNEQSDNSTNPAYRCDDEVRQHRAAESTGAFEHPAVARVPQLEGTRR